MPNLRFDIPGFEASRFGLTIMDDAEWPLKCGEEKLAHFTMLGNPELDAGLFNQLADCIAPGVTFSLMEGPPVIGSGVVEDVEERGHV